MDTAKKNRRVIDERKTQFWKESVQREQKLRLRWFMKHEEHFRKNLEEPITHKASDEIKEELRKTRQDYHMNRDYFVQKRRGDPDPPLVDPNAINEIMRPVDPKVKQLLYADQTGNRVIYLKEREKLLPEKRYYCPETTSFGYGWNMWECAKDKPNYGFGRCQIIQQSFYRRRGVDKDPAWYKEPEKLSPTVCGCL